MKKSNITGWQDVFTFTLVQTLKNKAFIVSYIIMLVMALVSMPLVSKLVSGSDDIITGPIPVNKVYINNETDMDIDFTGALENSNISHMVFENINEAYDTVEKRVQESEHDAVILTISDTDGVYSLNLLKASESSINEIHMQMLQGALLEQFDIIRLRAQGISEEQIAMLYANISTAVTVTDNQGQEVLEEDTSISMSEYWFIYGILFVVLMVNIMASTQIANSVVMEKSSRIVEYLLTSIKPLALMVGKILAMLTAVIAQMGSMVLVVFISNRVTQYISSGGDNILASFLPQNIFQNLNIINIILCFILIGLGMIFYATFAGLAGAMVSKMEEVSEGLTLFSIINLVGAYVGIGAAGVLMGAGDNPFVTFAFLFPLSSPFVLPGAILIGKAGIAIATLAIIIQILFIILLFLFVAKVYETLILYNGQRLKIKDLVKISKTV
ncbi:MAG: ABC transporter permease [Clostridiales bacterium]|nr:ABC transporter permease [Clostridiales bacterium]